MRHRVPGRRHRGRRQAGRRRGAPGRRWSGPTVVGHLAGVGVRISTSGAPERQGIVQRLDVGTSGLMTVAKSEHAYTVLKQAFRDRARSTRRTTRWCRATPIRTPARSTRRSPGIPSTTSSSPCGPTAGPSITHYDTLEAHRYASLLTIKLETGRTHQIRVHLSALNTRASATSQYGADPTLAERLGLERQWLHAVRLGFDHPRTGDWVEFESPVPRRPPARARRWCATSTDGASSRSGGSRRCRSALGTRARRGAHPGRARAARPARRRRGRRDRSRALRHRR